MKKSLLIIVNPAAGRGEYKMNFGEAMHTLSKGGYDISLAFTTGRGDAINIARESVNKYDVLACAGGDGTLSEVMTGVMQSGVSKAIGYFPMGTANDVATTLELPKNNILAAAEKMLAGTPHPFDVGGFGENGFFSYIAAFGAFTEVSYETPQDMKRTLGHLAYVLQGMAALSKIESVRATVEYDGGIIEGSFLYGSVSNSTSVAGIIRLNEDMVRLGDGMSELVLVKDCGLDGIMGMLNSVVMKTFDNENLLILHTKKAKFTFDKPVAWTRDGEDGGKVQSIEIVNHHAPLELIF